MNLPKCASCGLPTVAALPDKPTLCAKCFLLANPNKDVGLLVVPPGYESKPLPGHEPMECWFESGPWALPMPALPTALEQDLEQEIHCLYRDLSSFSVPKSIWRRFDADVKAAARGFVGPRAPR